MSSPSALIKARDCFFFFPSASKQTARTRGGSRSGIFVLDSVKWVIVSRHSWPREHKRASRSGAPEGIMHQRLGRPRHSCPQSVSYFWSVCSLAAGRSFRSNCSKLTSGAGHLSGLRSSRLFRSRLAPPAPLPVLGRRAEFKTRYSRCILSVISGDNIDPEPWPSGLPAPAQRSACSFLSRLNKTARPFRASAGLV